MKEELYSLDPSARITYKPLKSDTSQQHTTKIYEALQEDIFFIRLKQIAWKEFCNQSKSETDADLSKQMRTMFEETGLKEVLKNTVVKLHEKCSAVHMKKHDLDQFLVTARTSSDEPVDSIRLARIAWENGINEELHAICNESKRPFARIRQPGEVNPLLEQNPNIQGTAQDAVKFLFDSEDLLETGIAIRNFNAKASVCDRYLGLIGLNLNVLSAPELMIRFPELLSSSMPQLGLDELTPQYGSKLSLVRHEEAEALCADGSMLEARYFMRRGVPPSLRHKVWRVALGLSEEALPAEERLVQRMRSECDRLDLLTDELFLHDIQTVIDDPRFFVFEEELKEVVFSFSRDEWVRDNCHFEIHRPITDLITSGSSGGSGSSGSDFAEGTSAPPCGIQPFLGFATYFAPLCYVFKNRASLYSVSRTLFCRLWCKLNVLSGDGDTLLTVCKTFECLLMQSQPQLFLHLVNLGLQPLKVAFPWIQLGFAGLLEMDQLLHLWDRVIGYMDPLILAVAAVAVFVYRAEALLRCNSETDATLILLEGSRLHIIPIIQMLFYKEAASP